MHEWSLVCDLLRQVEDLAAANNADRVIAIRLRIGEFSGVEADLLASAYDQLVHETRLAGATLEIQREPLRAVCDTCGDEFRIERFEFQCRHCGSLSLTFRGGEELMLESVVLDAAIDGEDEGP
jgi:hydrogenase nickel incorporation protein HypA/HybF